MRYGSGEKVGFGLQILGHESAIGSTDTPHPLGVHPRMVGTELTGALYDVVGSVVAVGIDVACRELLSEACASAWLHNQHHIAQCGIGMCGIAALEIATDGRASAIIIHDHGILPVGVEMRRQIIAAGDFVAQPVSESPGTALTERHILQVACAHVVSQLALHGPGVERVESVGVAGAFSPPHHVGRGSSQGESFNEVFRCVYPVDFQILGVQPVKAY